MLNSKYFIVSEFDCHNGDHFPIAWIDDRLQKLVDILDPIREAWCGPIHVRSGYRTPEWNVKVGGAPHSQHVQGRAADIYPNDPADSDRLWALILKMYEDKRIYGLGGLGRYPGKWVHVDVRDQVPPGHLAQWTGSGVGSEQ